MAADVGRLQPARDFSPAGETRMNAAAGVLKPPPQAEASPTWTGGPTLALKCEVIPAPALRFTVQASGQPRRLSSRHVWGGGQRVRERHADSRKPSLPARRPAR